MNPLKRLEFWAYVLLIGCGTAFAYIFISIKVTGGYKAQESNLMLLYPEMIMGFVFITIGFICLVRFMKRILK
jgi:hypothetical protein